MTEDWHLVQNPKRVLGPLLLQLDDTFFKKIDQLKHRFPYGAPSMLECISLNVQGDVFFGQGVRIKGRVAIANKTKNQVTIPDGSVIDSDMVFE
jgi:UTP--glucose-1-phosphate uridylyltransferase